jgi:hypothetical protein
MTMISRSNKFDGNQIQSCVLAGGYVILRAIYRQQDLVVMTATARETAPEQSACPYPDQATLIATAELIFEAVGGDVTNRQDRRGRPYVQTIFPDPWTTLPNLAKQIAAALHLNDVQIVSNDGSDNALVDLWHDLAQDPLDDHELVYLSDGVYVRKDGRLIEP